MALLQIIYSSTLNSSENALESILERSRYNNQVTDLTGMLLYANGRILQVLEGDELKVERIFNTILTDARHRDISVISKVEIPERSFRQWSMGFRSLRAIDFGRWPEYGTLFGFSPTEIAFRGKPGSALQALVAFSRDLND